MSEEPRGYDLTVLAWCLGLYPLGVESTPIDGFRVTDQDTGISIDWEPHRNVAQARHLFWDLLPLRGVHVQAFSIPPKCSTAYRGWVMTTDAPELNGHDVYTY